ncbi:hydroxyacid oxidase 1 [Apiospora arundinis]
MSLAERPHTTREKEMPCDSSLCDIEKKSTSTERACDSYSATSSPYDEPILDDFVEMDETSLIAQATAQMVQKKAMDVNTPQLPRKSSRRASRLLLSDLKIDTVDPSQTLVNTPHDVYLSSEEDASSSAGDFSDYDYDSSSEASQPSPVGRKSHEDKARVVSVIFSGKPCIVNLTGPKRATSPAVSDKSSSSNSRPQTSPNAERFDDSARRPAPFTASRNSSFYSVASVSHSRSGSTSFTRRSSLYSTDSASRRPPSFLSIDPFAHGSDYSLGSKAETTTPRTPRTPTAVFNRMQQTLGLHRRRSRPMLHETNSKATSSRESFFSLRTSSSLNLTTNVSPEPRPSPLDRTATTPVEATAMSPQQATTPRRYSSAWKKIAPSGNSQPMSPLSPAAAKKAILGTLHLNKRKSLRL